MTTGQIIFFCGVALLVLTIILAIVFIAKKPKYIPGNAIYSETDKGTQKLRNGYPTDRLTVRREPAHSINPDTAVLSGGKAKLSMKQTVKLIGTAALPGQETVKLQRETTSLSDGTAKLQQAEETAQLYVQGDTVVLSEVTEKLTEEHTEKLMGIAVLPGQETEKLSAETMLLSDELMKPQQVEGSAQLYDQDGAAKGGTEKLDSSGKEGT